jgi:hypothetical protein
MFNTFPPENRVRLRDNVGKHGGLGEATDDNITRRMHSARWITKATNTHSEYVIGPTYCFPTTRKVTRTPLSATLCVHHLS